MRKASKVLFLVGGIVSCVEALSYLIMGIVFIFLGASEDFKNDLLKNYSASDLVRDLGNGVTPADAVQAIQAMYVALGVIFIIGIFISAVNAVLAFKARNSNNKVLFILNIVFGFISGCIINAIGGILAVASPSEDTAQIE